MDRKTGILLLAAGASSRMGRPKALLKIGDKTLIEKKVEDLLETGYKIFVVTGAHRNDISPLLENYICTEVHNPKWIKGMGTSIAIGVQQLRLEGFNSVLIVALDQVLVTGKSILSLLEISRRHPGAIVSAQYGKTRGIPALFPFSYFDELESLQGDKGAKKIISSHPENCIFYNLPEAELDLDAMKEYLDFIQPKDHENN